MLFSSPDYPVFLIAVFFLYALSRYGTGFGGRIGRIALMVLLGDLVFVLVSKQPEALWDPLGGLLYGLAAAGDPKHPFVVDATLLGHWAVGLALLCGALAAGMRGGAWIGSDRGQRWIARGMVGTLVIVASFVAINWQLGVLDEASAAVAAHGHLLVLAVLGVGIGAAQVDSYRPLGRIVILFVGSSLFYQAWAVAMPGPYRYLLAVLLGTIVLDYYLAIWIENTEHPLGRKALVIVSLCSNLGILCFFKYTDFFTQDVLHLGVGKLNLILPAGISFHTFQSLSYTIDVYRKQLTATRSPIQFATFVLFFPQLVAGPIVRAQDLLPQLSDLPALELDKATRGLYRILVGLFQKIALADTLAVTLVDRTFEHPHHFTQLEMLAGVYGWALQIYLDFAAYSNIAIGSALLLGFELPENFRTPYRSGNLQEFWRRWHISLSTWLRDYLYITLGGSRGAEWRTYLNLSLTMLLGGLWHGARWTYIVWGALHGFGLAITRFFQRTTGATRTAARSMLTWCFAIAAAGVLILRYLVPDDAGTWNRLVFGWLTLTPLWAVLTAWLTRDELPEQPQDPFPTWPMIGVMLHTWRTDPQTRRVIAVEALRIAMCGAAIVCLVALDQWETWTWIPLALVTWGFGIAADAVEGSLPPLAYLVRRTLAVVLVFHYVCLAWVFFRATSFDNALDVLRTIATGEDGHANLVPIVTTALAVGFLSHFFADNSFRWLRERFVALPAWAQGLVLVGAALVLRELAHDKIVKFIYFQF